MPSSFNKRRAGGALLLAALLAAAALAAAAAQGASMQTLSIAVSPSSATVGVAPESGAVNVVTSDSGVKEATIILFQLKTGATVAEAESFIAKKEAAHDPNKSSKLGSIVFDAEGKPGAKAETQTYLQPGTYLVLVGAGEHEVQMRASFTVKASAAPVALPTPQATIRSIEFGFRGPSVLHDGELVRFENEGWLVHMDIALPVKSMKAAKQAVKDLLTGNEKPLGKLIAGEPIGFAGPLSHGAYQQETITAKPGIYVQACFMETQDKRDHTRLGMERIIRIVK